MNKLGIVLVQMRVGADRDANVSSAVAKIRAAYSRYPSARLFCLPECFNAPYSTACFAQYAEAVPAGYTSQQLAALARELRVYILGGTLMERDETSGLLYNTAPVFGPDGSLVARHRKAHLFDIALGPPLFDGERAPFAFSESAVLTAGAELTAFRIDGDVLVGVGICFDIYFDEYARALRRAGCDVLVFPNAFNTTIGPMHWDLLNRARAADNQVYTVSISPARVAGAEYEAWGHSMVTDPWGRVLVQADVGEETVYQELDLSAIPEFRRQIPLWEKRREDVYAQYNRIAKE